MLRLRLLPVILFALAPLLTPPLPVVAADCQFILGFAALKALIDAAAGPDKVGACLENQRFNPENGDALQQTTGGLLVWRKADNWTAFTDGYRTWINGPHGLQARLNTEQFEWELPAEAAPVIGQPQTVRLRGVLGVINTFEVTLLEVLRGAALQERLGVTLTPPPTDVEEDVAARIRIVYVGSSDDDRVLPSHRRTSADFERRVTYNRCPRGVYASFCYRHYQTDPVSLFTPDGSDLRTHYRHPDRLPPKPTVTAEGVSGWRLARKFKAAPLSLRIEGHLDAEGQATSLVLPLVP